MSIYNAGAVIKEARKKAGYSQEMLAEGICSVLALSKIENGSMGVCPSTFQCLIERAGANEKVFPEFLSKEEYLVFHTMLDIPYYLDCWQLDIVNEKILEVEKLNWADNKLYYQQCQLYKGILLLKSHTCNYEKVKKLLLEALQITYPIFLEDGLWITKFHQCLFSITEIELLIAMAECFVYLNRQKEATEIAEQIEGYLDKTQIVYHEKSILKAKNSIAMTKALLTDEKYEAAYEKAETMRKSSIEYCNYQVLPELTFLTGICQYQFGNVEEAYRLFEISYYSAYSSNSIYATIIRKWGLENLKPKWEKELFELSELPLKKYYYEEERSVPKFSGIYAIDTDKHLMYQIGDIIRDTRRDRKISQEMLAKGVCNRSTLSKIENNTMNPDKFLAEVLLQRLGIYSDAFTMYGNEKEAKIYTLKKEITTKVGRNEKEEAEKLMEELERILDNKTDTNYQFYLFMKALTTQPSDEVELLREALNCTLPDFEFDKIQEYCLSYNEHTILNNLVRKHLDISYFQGIQMLYRILEYHDKKEYDIQEKNRTYSVTVYMLIKSLYNAKRYEEVMELMKQVEAIINGYHYDITGRLYFFYSQVLGELKMFDKVPLFAKYSCSNEELVEQNKQAELLKKYLQEDFGIMIE